MLADHSRQPGQAQGGQHLGGQGGVMGQEPGDIVEQAPRAHESDVQRGNAGVKLRGHVLTNGGGGAAVAHDVGRRPGRLKQVEGVGGCEGGLGPPSRRRAAAASSAAANVESEA